MVGAVCAIICNLAASAQSDKSMTDKPIFEDVTVEEVLSFKGNPYGLVYDNAIMANEPGKVNIHPITYGLDGLRIAANVYTPADYDPAKKYPALVVAHPNGGVKEQVAGNYAQIMAGRGYIIMALLASGFLSRGFAKRMCPADNLILHLFLRWRRAAVAGVLRRFLVLGKTSAEFDYLFILLLQYPLQILYFLELSLSVSVNLTYGRVL